MKVLNIFKGEAGVGIILIVSTVFALFLANSTFSSFYSQFLDAPIKIQFGNFELAKPLILWVNDGLMAIFFFLVGLEVKREILEGTLFSLKGYPSGYSGNRWNGNAINIQVVLLMKPTVPYPSPVDKIPLYLSLRQWWHIDGMMSTLQPHTGHTSR